MIKCVRRVDCQEDWTGLGQSDQKRLVSHRMTWCEDHFYRAVSEQIVEVRCGPVQKIPVNVRFIEVFSDVAAGGKPIWCKRVSVLLTLDDVDRVRKSPGGSGVVKVKM